MVLLQEIHFSRTSAPKYLSARYPTSYFSNGPEKKGGVAICIAKRVPFTPDMVIKDKEGRYVMVVGRINEQAITLVSYYAPKAGQVQFLETMLATLIPHAKAQTIIGGDSNVPLDQALDRSNPHKPVLKHTPKQGCKLARLLHSYNLIDVWRDLHLTTRDYTHYSHVHKTYSRIDHVVTLSQLLPSIKLAKILDVTWSDHSLVQICLSDLWTKPTSTTWRLNASLLNDPIIFT